MVNEIVRVGIVVDTNPDAGRVRVKLVDVDDEVSQELPVIQKKTLLDKDYWMPDIDEHVVCLFLGQGLEQGFVLGAIYSEADAVPVSSQDKWHKKFEDGTFIEYDRSSHKLTATIEGDIEATVNGDVTAIVHGDIAATVVGKVTVNVQGDVSASVTGSVTLETPTTTIKGDLKVEGDIEATGKIIDVDGNTNHHSH